jgi:hypothetical protein
MIIDFKIKVEDGADFSVARFESEVVPDLGDQVAVHSDDYVDKNLKHTTYEVISREFHVMPISSMIRTTNGTRHKLDFVICKVKECK